MSATEVWINTFMWETVEQNYTLFIDAIGHNKASETIVVRVPYRPWFLVNCVDKRVADMMVVDVREKMRRGIHSTEVVQRKRSQEYVMGDEMLWCVKFTLTNMSNYYYARKLCTRQSDRGVGAGGEKSVPIKTGRYERYMYMDKHEVQLEFDINQTHKFLLDHGFNMHQWLKVTNAEEADLNTRFRHQYRIPSASLIQLVCGSELKAMPAISPKTLSFDIEVNADNTLAMPVVSKPSDEIYLVTACFCDEVNPPRNYAFTHMNQSYATNENETLVRTKNEIETILSLFDLIVELDADFIIGHNIFGFDNPYIDGKLGSYNIPYPDFSRYKGTSCESEKFEWGSSARKQEYIFYFKCKGRLWLDTLQYSRIYYKLRSYSLKALAKHFLELEKIDLPPKEQFRLYRSGDITRTVEYGIRDAVIPVKLFKKMECWLNVTADSNVRNINIFDIYTRGQGVGVLAQAYTMAYKNDFFLSPFNKVKVSDKYKGATVLDAKVGMYEKVFHLDFAGLYPSIVMAYNLCYSTLVTDPSVPDDMCNVFNVPSKSGEVRRMRFIKKEYREGIVPKFLRENKEARDSVKKQMKSVPYMSFEYQVLDVRQNNIKLSSNGTYGAFGSVNGKTPCFEAAEVTTCCGRDGLELTVKMVQEKFHGFVVYGDSDTIRSHTPLLVKYRSTGTIDYVQIGDLIALPESATDGQEFHDLTGKDIDVWTENGWSAIKYLMRHKTTKRLFRVVTHTGIVDVTEDHSLLTHEGKEITPNEVSIGMALLHHDLPNVVSEECPINEDLAWAWGFFMAEGTCGTYKYSKQTKHCWSMSNIDHEFLDRAKAIMDKEEPNNFFIIDICNQAVDKLSARGKDGALQALVKKFEVLFYTTRSTTIIQNVTTDKGIRYKKVPVEILMAPNKIKLSFLQGWCDGDGAKTEGNVRRFDIKGQIGAAGLFYLASAVGYKVSVNTRTDKEDIYRLTLTRNSQKRPSNTIKKIIPMGTCTEDVFDIETENHHFGAGIGRMIVHNSVLFTIPHIDDEWKPHMDTIGKKIAEEISKSFPPPMKLEFEKWWVKYLLVSKKNYFGYLADPKDVNAIVYSKDNKYMQAKGVPLVKRDNPIAIQDMYFEMANTLFQDPTKALEVYEKHLVIMPTKEMKDMAPSLTIGSDYKQENNSSNLFIQSMKAKGITLLTGDRIEFVLVLTSNSNEKYKGNKMMLLDMAEETNAKLDYHAYIKGYYEKKAKKLFEIACPEMLPEFVALTKRYLEMYK